MDATLIQALVGSGPLGLIIAWMMWERRQDKADRKELEQKRLDHDERRLAADLRMIAALTALTLKVTGQVHDPQA